MSPTNQHTDPTQRRNASWLEKWLILIGVAILIVLLMRMLGIPLIHRSETIEVLEHPHQ